MNCKSGVTMLLAGFSQWRHALSQLGFACSFCRCAMNKADTLGTYCIEVCVMNKMRMHSFFFLPFLCLFCRFFCVCVPALWGSQKRKPLQAAAQVWKGVKISLSFCSVPFCPLPPCFAPPSRPSPPVCPFYLLWLLTRL